ncbi:MAG: hypothetical protein JWR19_1063 [Pedosphaera sp.]|nr:hypothetical protein [Pedosphaera sp.]
MGFFNHGWTRINTDFEGRFSCRGAETRSCLRTGHDGDNNKLRAEFLTGLTGLGVDWGVAGEFLIFDLRFLIGKKTNQVRNSECRIEEISN